MILMEVNVKIINGNEIRFSYREETMNRKIEIIQESSNSQSWHWIILEYDSVYSTWHNIRSGLEESYDIACSKAKSEYDSL